MYFSLIVFFFFSFLFFSEPEASSFEVGFVLTLAGRRGEAAGGLPFSEEGGGVLSEEFDEVEELFECDLDFVEYLVCSRPEALE